MATEETSNKRRFPGLLDLAILGVGLAAVAVYLGRGRIGGEVALFTVLGVDALWLAARFLQHRATAPEVAPRTAPLGDPSLEASPVVRFIAMGDGVTLLRSTILD